MATSPEQRLMQLLEAGQEEEAIALVESDEVDVNYVDQYGATPLMHACYYNLGEDIVEVLLNAGANPNYKNKAGGTPLILATICRNDFEVIDLLIKAKADVNAANETGSTPIIFATRNKNSTEVISALIKAGANVNAATNSKSPYKGYTALHFAAADKQHDIASVLVKCGADPYALTLETKKTPLDIADVETRSIILKARDARLKKQQAAAVIAKFKPARATVADVVKRGTQLAKMEISKEMRARGKTGAMQDATSTLPSSVANDTEHDVYQLHQMEHRQNESQKFVEGEDQEE